MNILQKLSKQNLIHPPQWLADNTCLLNTIGSNAYGVKSDNSDHDVFGICIPPKRVMFPHSEGRIFGFDFPNNPWDEWEQHHVKHGEDKEYDFKVYSIVKFFKLAMVSNPSIIGCLFVPRRCVLHSTQIGEKIRDNRHLFLSKVGWKAYRGYAYSQMSKLDREPEGKRKALVEQYGYDTKYAMHLVRLLSEYEYILRYHDLDIEHNKEQLKAIRNGTWSLQQVREYFHSKEKELEGLNNKSTLKDSVNQEDVKSLLIECLEMHYRSIEDCVQSTERPIKVLQEISDILYNNRSLLQ